MMACIQSRLRWTRLSTTRLTQPSIPRAYRRHISTLNSSAASLDIPGHTVTLPSGRLLGYHTSGPTTGTPVLYIHGHPDSGLTITGQLETRAAERLGIRWIGPDRPGVGLSTPYDAQTVLDYPSDIQSLVEHLGLKSYYILGTSGGTGFALACAKDLPRSQVGAVGICAGIGPYECGFDSMVEPQRKALEAWRDYPAEFKAYYESEYVPLARQNDIAALADRIRGEFEAGFSGADREVLLEENAFAATVKTLRQAWVQGAWAHAKGMELHWRPWGFALEDVAFPGVRLWYASRDGSTTPVMGRFMADRLPRSVYKEFPGDSHFTIWRDGNLQEMLRDLLGAGHP
ncbi:hypothetical protein ANO14919_126030 [Xylariales sp. No.14919]|nr:hypothetical protein ANO14919_126030 [Xylariales sp. No.14919]